MNIEEFKTLVFDIISHPDFQSQKHIRHHNGNVYTHSLVVGFLSYKIVKMLGGDFRAAARAGVLHDFFLYDWKELPHKKATFIDGLRHFRTHSNIAAKQAETIFNINKLEKSIILRHMFPVTFTPPTSLEAIVICCVDKYVAILEFGKPSFKYRRFDIV